MECSSCITRSSIGYCVECRALVCEECSVTCRVCGKLVCRAHVRETPHRRQLCPKCYARRNSQFESVVQEMQRYSRTLQEDVSESQVLDIAQALAVTGANPKILKRITGVFLESVPAEVDQLEQAIAAGQQDEAHRLAHSIRGASASLGGARMSDVAFKIERAAQEADLGLAGRLITEIRTELSRLTQALGATDWDKAARHHADGRVNEQTF